MISLRAKMLIPVQGGATLCALAALTLWPPASGEMLLVPLAYGDANMVAKVALAGGAMLVGTGPLAGSMVVVGERSRIAHQTGAWSVLIMAAPRAGCGKRSAIEATA